MNLRHSSSSSSSSPPSSPPPPPHHHHHHHLPSPPDALSQITRATSNPSLPIVGDHHLFQISLLSFATNKTKPLWRIFFRSSLLNHCETGAWHGRAEQKKRPMALKNISHAVDLCIVESTHLMLSVPVAGGGTMFDHRSTNQDSPQQLLSLLSYSIN